MAPPWSPRDEPDGEWIHAGSFSGTAAVEAQYDAERWTQRSGDTFVDTSAAGVVTMRWSGAVWQTLDIFWDGESAGETIGDLPTSDVVDDATAIVGTHWFEWDGSRWLARTQAVISISSIVAPDYGAARLSSSITLTS